jgi:hypothetical protein
MAYHFTYVPRQERPPISPEELCRRLHEALGLTGTFAPAEKTLNVASPSGELLLKIFHGADKSWWTMRVDEPEFELFVQIAEAMDCDVEGDAREMYRFEGGKSVMFKDAPPEPPVPIWKQRKWRHAFLLTILVLVFAIKYFTS